MLSSTQALTSELDREAAATRASWSGFPRAR